VSLKDILLRIVPHLQFREEQEQLDLRAAIEDEYPPENNAESADSEADDADTNKSSSRRTPAGVKKADGSPNKSE
jgi:hypothetical protein